MSAAGFTYVVRCQETGLFKIGSANNVEGRVGQFKTGSASHHEVVIQIGGREWERRFHERYAHLRRKGEWFALTADAITEIRVVQRSGEWPKRTILDDGETPPQSIGEDEPMPRSYAELSAWASDLSLSHPPQVVAAIISAGSSLGAADRVAEAIRRGLAGVAHGDEHGPAGLEGLALVFGDPTRAGGSISDAVDRLTDQIEKSTARLEDTLDEVQP